MHFDGELDAARSLYVKHVLALLPEGRQDPRDVQIFPVAPSELTRTLA